METTPDTDRHCIGLTQLSSREQLSALMDGMLGAPGRTVAFTHAPVVRAAILHAVGAPLGCARHIDVEPLSVTDIRSDGRRWVLRATGITAPKRKGAAEAEAGG